MVKHPARRADDDVDPPAEGLELTLDRLAAVDPTNRHITVMGKLLQLTDNLLSQLPRRRQNDALRSAGPRLQHFDQRDAKSGRLAGTGLGLTDDVQTIKGSRNKGRLDRGGGGVMGVCQGLEHHRAQTHRMESRSGFLLGSSIQTILQKCQSSCAKWVAANDATQPPNVVSLVLTTLILSVDEVSSKALRPRNAALRDGKLCRRSSGKLHSRIREGRDFQHFVPQRRSMCLLRERLCS